MTDRDSRIGSAKVSQGSMMTFLPGVDLQTREDILLANRFAQKVARENFNEGLEDDWFRTYWRNLSFLGFDGKTMPELRRVGPDRATLGEEAVRHITDVGSSELSSATRRSLQLLQGDGEALKTFQAHVRAKDHAHFQLLPCRQQASGFVDMVLFHLEVKVQLSVLDFLFFTARDQIEVVDLRVELVHFNLAGFRSTYKKRAEASVGRGDLAAIRELRL